MGDLEFQQRKTVNVGWDTSVIKGMSVSISAQNTALDEEEEIEVRNTANDGWATITFPFDFEGDCEITVRGSKGGEQSGTVTVK
jgi:hypothetical protein